MDYLLRDAQATGVPYGQVDVNYLLNRLQVDKTGLIGVSQRAIPAAEHFLFARYFMYRVVYYHKTTLGFEEVCRHLLRRLRDKGEGDVPADGKAIWRIVSTKRLLQFTDSMLDQIIHDASTSRNRVIRALASTLSSRHPPQLLKEVQWFSDGKQEIAPPALFERNCKEKLASLSKKHGIPLGQFIFVETKPLKIEQRGAEILAARANELQPENEDELIRVMDGNVAKPLVETENSIIRYSSHTIFRMSRLYVVCPGGENSHAVEKLRKAVKDWDKH
ncbi:MAG: hypothetical protein GHCLOJNM_02135 [bacterium]|nr:hypothetical protein [bacterium]